VVGGGEQSLLFDHAEFVNGDAEEVGYFGFADFRMIDDGLRLFTRYA